MEKFLFLLVLLVMTILSGYADVDSNGVQGGLSLIFATILMVSTIAFIIDFFGRP
jgi:hypothetical protein